MVTAQLELFASLRYSAGFIEHRGQKAKNIVLIKHQSIIAPTTATVVTKAAVLGLSIQRRLPSELQFRVVTKRGAPRLTFPAPQ